MSTEAKNCPICGDAPKIERSYVAWHVFCPACRDLRGVDLDCQEDAEYDWNQKVLCFLDAEFDKLEAARERNADRHIDEARGK